MADKTKIEWTDATWNPITGCSVVSPGCTNCYAMRLAGTRLRDHPSRAGLTTDSKAGPVWNGEVRFNTQWLDQPLRWKKPRMIFVCAHGDLFHENVPDEWIDQVFAVMALAPQHTFQVLTKRPERMRAWFAEKWQGTPAAVIAGIEVPAGGETGRMGQVEKACEPFLSKFGLVDPGRDELWTHDGKCAAMQWQWPLPNVWLGVSVEDQKRADERIPLLMATPAAVRWLSAEPLLGPVDLEVAWNGESALEADCWGDCGWCSKGHPPLHNCTRNPQNENCGLFGVDWVVVGGESGPGARPMHPDWPRQIRNDCLAAGVPFHFKQWGAWTPGENTPDPDKRYPTKLWFNREWQDCDDHWSTEKDHGPILYHVGKSAAGRHLDGVIHDGFPEVAV